tara:strand:+ start:981 stop:2561 length:1581 start_codon:yes stop_codon:yes gene_type:complete
MAGKEEILTTDIFKKNPISSSKYRGYPNGKIYSVFYTQDSEGIYWRLNWKVPDTSTFIDSYLCIESSNSRMTIFEYPTDGISKLSSIPTATKVQIVNDFNSHISKSVEEKEEEVEEYNEALESKINIVREEVSYGVTITMSQHVNSLDIRSGEDRMFYMVKTVGFNGDEKNIDSMFQSQEEAENAFEYQMKRSRKLVDNSTSEDFEGVSIKRNSFEHRDGSLSDDFSKITYQLSGKIEKDFITGEEVTYSYSRYVQDGGDNEGMLRDEESFGTLTGESSLDIPILKSYITYRLNPILDDEFALKSGMLEVRSWGWYVGEGRNSFENPFEKITVKNVYTIANTEGRILGLNDDDLALSNANLESGTVRLVIKDGFRVRFKLMTQYRNYFIDNIPALDSVAVSHEQYDLKNAQAFNQETNYTDTDKMTFDMLAGDSIEIDVDDNDDTIERFQIMIDGSSIVGGAPRKLNDETFLAIIEVEKVSSGSRPTSPVLEEDGDDEKTSPWTYVFLVLGLGVMVGLIYFVMRDE